MYSAKPDGSNKFSTDFRRVNYVTKPDSFPIPRVLDCIDKTCNISVFDYLKGWILAAFIDGPCTRGICLLYPTWLVAV